MKLSDKDLAIIYVSLDNEIDAIRRNYKETEEEGMRNLYKLQIKERADLITRVSREWRIRGR